jgi:hypothetical protein
MKIDVSIGEIVDKLSILHIKKDNITDEAKIENINKEYLYLHEIVFSKLNISYEDYSRLLAVNKSLWIIRDKLRHKENINELDGDFIEIARSSYHTNDERANIKKAIDIKYNSIFVGEKSDENGLDRKLSQEERIKWFVSNYYETGMELDILLVSMKDTDLDNFIWYGETIDIPKSSLEAVKMNGLVIGLCLTCQINRL